jgi:SagB-type dehydrogenase family enzyme
MLEKVRTITLSSPHQDMVLRLSGVSGSGVRCAASAIHYVPDRHELREVASGHQREKLVGAARGQEWIATAAAVVCVAADFERTTGKYGLRGRGYVYMEAGLAAESLMLQATALGLATTMVGAFDDEEVKRLLRLSARETPLCLIAVGAPESGDRSGSKWDI